MLPWRSSTERPVSLLSIAWPLGLISTTSASSSRNHAESYRPRGAVTAPLANSPSRTGFQFTAIVSCPVETYAKSVNEGISLRTVPERTARVSLVIQSACRTSNPNNFVAVWIPEIGEVSAIRADARWILD
jgi:hypothetical protein